MEERFDVHLRLTTDEPNSMNFSDTYDGLKNPWYKFEADPDGSVTLRANAEGFEHLARYFLKMARTGKNSGYHAHHGLELGAAGAGPSELTICIVDAPNL